MTFRPLLIFWAIILSLAAATAVTLQLLGPPQFRAAPSLAPAVRPHVPPAPAQISPSRVDPAPRLRMTGQAIPEPDPALQEPAIDYADRMMPRVADNGRSPSVLYAAAFDPAERHPRVALVLDGAGLDRALTEQAMQTLPSAIDLAFSAYAPASSAARMAQEARRQGRECLVSIPMEPSGFPAAEEGDRSLLIGGDPGQNRQDLEWALSNVQGCVGATGGSDGLNGERFAESRRAFGDVLSAIDRRGLIYLDPRPLAPPPDDAMPGRGLPRIVDVIVDRAAAAEDPADAATIDRNLARLEKLALTRGTAIGLAGPPTPVLLDRLAVWSQGLAARGLVLAPLTAIPPPSLPTEAARQ
jgi:polysaccharide deacetylase 2 family uncharacterized protein YibQ